jgi:hypothetical protein
MTETASPYQRALARIHVDWVASGEKDRDRARQFEEDRE